MAEAPSKLAGRLHIRVIAAAALPPRQATTGPKKCDAFVKVKLSVGKAKQKTSAAKSTLNPVWNEFVSLDLPRTHDMRDEHVLFQVKQEHFFRDTVIGEAKFPLSRFREANNDEVEDWIAVTNSRHHVVGQLNVRVCVDNSPVGRCDSKQNAQRRLDILRTPLPRRAFQWRDANVWIGTWNVGNDLPPKDLREWIPTGGYDLYVIGTQECNYKFRTNKFQSCNDDFVDLLTQHFGARHELVAASFLGEMRLQIFCRSEVAHEIRFVSEAAEGTGLLNLASNKGGIAASFHFRGTSLCFVNSHLEAHQDAVAARNEDYREIIAGLQVGCPSSDIVSQFHHVFWLGDLNYRLDFGSQGSARTPAQSQFDEMVGLIDDGQLGTLFATDQLTREREAERAFVGFRDCTGYDRFPPTFKVKRGEMLKYTAKRSPAWTDRVLWKSSEGFQVEQTGLSSVPTITTSDHKPVWATFKVPCAPLTPIYDDSKGAAVILARNLRARDLIAGDLDGTSDPYLKFASGLLLQDSVQTSIVYKTLNPDWTDELRVRLNYNNADRLVNELLLIRMKDYDRNKMDDTIGQAVYPLRSLVTRAGEWIPVTIPLQHNGLPAGAVQAELQFEWLPMARTQRARTRSS